ncbi:sugar phosphate nucleotidyltransferase [Halopseudomonas pachastrellae]|nr:sugar phosphate nucleotidyltransferase [Halopseudomonas pachastrellae]
MPVSVTRFLPASKAIPKEMITVVDKPVIQYVVDEAVRAGIKQIVLVNHSAKRAIEDHFDVHYELENELERRGKEAAQGHALHSAAGRSRNQRAPGQSPWPGPCRDVRP